MKKTHGMRKHELYGVWCGMRYRCYRERDIRYKWYGARGIKVCERWRTSFAAFVEDMGPRPPGHTLDRIDNDGDYSPSNCRWATPIVQTNNARTNKIMFIYGEAMTASDAARRFGLNASANYARLRDGWSDERAATTPIRKHKDYERSKRKCSNERATRI